MTTTTTSPAAPSPVNEHVHRDRQDWWVPIFRGGWLMIAGAFALVLPPTSGFALALLFAATVFISAGVLLTNGVALRSPLPITQGVLSLGAAAVVALLPQARWQEMVLVIGAWSIAMGAIDVLMLRRHHHVRGRAFLAGAGSLGIIAGVLCIGGVRFNDPLPLWSFGLMALLAGGALVGYGMRRRRRSGHVSAVNAAHRDEERRFEDAHPA